MKREVANVLLYYPGHYESNGLNSQACVLSDLQFMYFGVVSLDSMNDNISFTLADDLKVAFSKLPSGMFGLADAGYTS